MNPHRIIAENTAGSEHWRDGSFIDILHETHRWDTDEYWRLEWSLYAVCADSIDSRPDADVFRIFSYVMLLFSCHFDPSDGVAFADLDHDELYEFRERFQLMFEGYFRRSMPLPASFDAVNPLMET